jgi:glyoxylase-like metal-dependent hydrolase (beta-lactamase superfamily II)
MMTEHLTRRGILLAGAAMGATAGLGAERAHAQAPQGRATPLASPGGNAVSYRFQIGNIRATIISDGTITGNVRVYARNAEQAELDAVLGAANLSQEQFVLQLNAMLLEQGGRKILVDPGANLAMGPNGGRLIARLAELGVTPNDIEAIVITHTHPDHVGNLRNQDGSPTFPKAVVHVPEPDWQFFFVNDPGLTHLPMPVDFRERFIRNIKSSLEAVAGNVTRYQPGREVLPGIATIPAAGHTPGMSALLISSGNDQLMVTADLAYHPLLNIDHAWMPGVDVDAQAARQTRNRLFDRAAADRLLLFGFHFPFPGLGRLSRRADTYRWLPHPWDFNG